MNARVITFDDLPIGTAFPLTYEGFQWSGGLALGSANLPYPTSLAGFPVANTFVIAQGKLNDPSHYAGKGIMQRSGPFNFVGMFLASAPTVSSADVEIEGWDGGRRTQNKWVKIDWNWRYYEFQFKHVDQVTIYAPADNAYIDSVFVSHA